MKYSLFIILFLATCSTNEIYERGALFDLIVRPYPNEIGLLSNQRCVEYKDGKCSKTDKKSWDLRNESQRQELIQMKFHCNVGGKRFGICSDYSGLCHTRPYRKSWFHSWTFPIYEYLDSEKDFQHLINSNTICAAMDSYVGQRLFLMN